MLLLQIALKLPTIIGTLIAIAALLPKFKGADFWQAMELIKELLGLVLTLAPTQPEQAKQTARDLYATLQANKPGDVVRIGSDPALTLKNELQALKDRCTGVGCAPELK